MGLFESFLASYGYLAVIVGTFFEGETVLVLAGLAAHRGYLSLPLVILSGLVGTLAGDQIYFQLGRRRGEAFLARRPAWRGRIARAEDFLERHHRVFILGFRFLYGLRTVSPFAIGMSGVRLRTYLLLTSLGALTWSVAISLAGYGLGEGAQVVLGRVKVFEGWLFGGIALLGLTAWLIRFFSLRRERNRQLPS